jgi:hypothetical protein
MVQRLYLVVGPRSEVTEVESPNGFSSCQGSTKRYTLETNTKKSRQRKLIGQSVQKLYLDFTKQILHVPKKYQDQELHLGK